MKILCFGYRPWALKIYKNIQICTDAKVIVIDERSLVDLSYIDTVNPDIILFYGWSWKIETEILTRYKCLMLHPSDLPKYRGGSPIQNQILDGIKISAVSIFRMTTEMDAGPIVNKAPLMLTDCIETIFERLTTIGTSLTLEILEQYPEEIVQDESEATYCKRRKPDMSEITSVDLTTQTAQYLHDKVRCLTGPYPRAYITASDGKKLYIESTFLDDD